MPGLAERALRIIRERYADFGPTLACEKLAEVHGLYLAKETVQDKRDNTRSQALPSLDGQTSRRKKQPGKKSQRSLNQDDMLEALQQLQTR